MAFTVPPLPYAFDALEPYIDKQTMEIHHDKHHAAYVTNLNKALESAPDLAEQDRGGIAGQQLRDRAGATSAPRSATMAAATSITPCSGRFWRPAPAAAPAGNVAQAINGRVRQLRSRSRKSSTPRPPTRFGSGWAWLIKSSKGIEIISTANQDSPMMEGKYPRSSAWMSGSTPII